MTTTYPSTCSAYPCREWWLRRHARTVCLNTNGGVTTYIYVQLHTYSPTLSSSSFLPSSLLCISWVRISVTLIVTAHVSLNHLPLITVIFTTECRNTRIHRVTAAHACIDRPFMQSMGLHTRTQRMLGTPQFFLRIEDHQVDNEERQRQL